MKTYLLTWNPAKSPWKRLSSDADKSRRGVVIRKMWSCGRIGAILPGDRIFFLMHHEGKHGIIASGFAVSPVFDADHWDPDKQKAGQEAKYVVVEFDTLLNPKHDVVLWENHDILKKGSWRAVGPIGILFPDTDKVEAAWAQLNRKRK
jgi:hypothetical protein